MSDAQLEKISTPEIKAALFSGGYAAALGLADGLVKWIFTPVSINLPLIFVCTFAVLLGLPQRHIISLVIRSRTFALRVAICFLFSIWIFISFDSSFFKILALIPSFYIFFSSFKYKSSDV